MEVIQQLIETSGVYNLTIQNVIMLIIACVFLYLGIKRGYEPYLMVPIAFGMLLVNLPLAGLMDAPTENGPGGLLYYLYQGTNLGIYPPLIFLCLGASTDFGPLLANPKTILLGGAAQFGIFVAFFLSVMWGMTPQEAASVGIIGGADGPTALFLTTRLAPHLLPAIALAAYSYMALVPIIQPPIIRALTTKKERLVKMTENRKVSETEKILFPIIVTIFVSLLVPSATPLVGCLMLGNLIKEIKVVPNITKVLQNAMMFRHSLLPRIFSFSPPSFQSIQFQSACPEHPHSLLLKRPARQLEQVYSFQIVFHHLLELQVSPQLVFLQLRQWDGSLLPTFG